ncbi:MAG: hypothetical protein MJY82_04520, partial [Fibrobacter sp.]|nr:hypothetical protein [Fibrobacter sp.]
MRLSIIAVSMMAAMAFAGETKGNICDDWSNGDVFQLKSSMKEIYWEGNFRTMSAESSSSKKINSVNEADQVIKKSLVDNNGTPIKVPMALTAACVETKNNEYKFVTCDKATGACEQKTANNYATQIYDVRDIKVEGFTSENAYNLLVMNEEELPLDGSYLNGSIMGSRTYDLAFEWWFAVAEYTVVDTIKGEDGSFVGTSTTTHRRSALTLDSASVFNSVVKSVMANAPESVNETVIRMLKVLLVEDKGTVPAGESSSSDASSSDSKDGSSSSVDQSSDSKD